MENPLLEIVHLNIQTDFKKLINVPHPAFLMEKDAIIQYSVIWQIIWKYVASLKAGRVLEFGTREGYSTQLFSRLLRPNQGHLWTVDLAKPKMSEQLLVSLDNVTFIQQDILSLEWKEPVDILYIDDWHNPYHLFQELEMYASMAKVVLIHDVVQNWQTHEWLIPAIFSWCLKENIPFVVYPLNACGLVAIHREEYQGFYEVER